MADRLKSVIPSGYRHLQSWVDEPEEREQIEDLGQPFRSCIATDTIHFGAVLPENIANFSELLANYSSYVNSMIERRWHTTLSDRLLSDLRSRVQQLENNQTLIVPVETLADENFEVIRPFSVVVESAGDEFTATLYDANVSASGETTEEALSNLKHMILETLELFETDVKLGAAMQKQKAVLKTLIRQKQVSPK